MTLISFSGGAQVAGLAAVTAKDLNVRKIVTLAGNLDHPAWCRYHKLPALTQSLDLTDYWAAFEAIPQVHFVCEDDTVIPPDITIRRIGGNAPVVVLPDASHASGWLKYSAQIYGQ